MFSLNLPPISVSREQLEDHIERACVMPSDVGRRNNMKPDPDGLSGSLRNTARLDCMLYGTGPLLLSIKTDSGGGSGVRDTENLGRVEVTVARHMVDKRTMGEPMEDGARCEEILTRIICWSTLSGFYLLLSFE
ncbi:hypothetical protein T10_2972 [Trichinella papuae]|uniref:Uncharacterized protein n=1 Tax=Trichinella papuae TaxID=268474 RepID=A0A0V1N2Z1_9BILA|nr:hypothetical protein T10_2972 [Trichinella papuae]